MVRPAITYGMFGLLLFVDVFGFWYAYHTGVGFETALNILWDDDSQQIFASIIAFYFGGQAFKK
jgi:ABC-type phosphate transport system permease subunit